MKRSRWLAAIAVVALLLGTARAETPSESSPRSHGESARVESAGPGGDRPTRTAEVQSAEYPPARHSDRIPTAPLALIAALGAGLVAAGITFRTRRRHARR